VPNRAAYRSLMLCSCAALLASASCTSESEQVGSSRQDAALPDGPPRTCQLDAPAMFSDQGAYEVGTAPVVAGAFVYFVGLGSSLSRVALEGGDVETLVEAVAAFTARGDRVFYVTYLGELGEVLADGSQRVRATDQRTDQLMASGDRIYYCARAEPPGSGQLFALSIDGDAAPIAIATSAARIGCAQVTQDALYWQEGGARPRIVRADRDGSDAASVVEIDGAAVGFTVNQHAIAFYTDAGIELRSLEGDADPVQIDDADGEMVLTDDALYFARRIECIPMPDVGNGAPACRDAIEGVSLDGAPLGAFELEGELGALTVDEACMYMYWVEVFTPCHPGCSTAVRAAPLDVLE